MAEVIDSGLAGIAQCEQVDISCFERSPGSSLAQNGAALLKFSSLRHHHFLRQDAKVPGQVKPVGNSLVES